MKPLGRKMYYDRRVWEMEPRGVMYMSRPTDGPDVAIVFDSEADFERAAAEIWRATILSDDNDSFVDIWPELRKRILGE